ncbi:Protein of unknown function DUF1042 domain-containing protein [Rozella allomycis CSF55]|uniref:CH-like domain-containing protein n=1 Tax=Rozella allomycis (strain CSF55) TaxID=988480 RepID=A0A075ART0_ROZAC|nr:Protein of unknown function DUF1042 domain-containing protein [Rozella allomycis CSF55]|eukprot:EPZ32885.1 Protein of unknown function DUF1042 domain-containing protein [Rozella allomycis CSF55]
MQPITPQIRELTEEELRDMFAWVDSFPLSRQKLMFAEILKILIPKYVELHNYPPSNSHQQKVVNWNTLNRIYLPDDYIQAIAGCQPGIVECILFDLRKILQESQSSLSNKKDTVGYGSQRDQIKQSAPIPIHKKGPKLNLSKPLINRFQSVMETPLSNEKEINMEEGYNSQVLIQESKFSLNPAVTEEEKDQIILELQETVEILQIKIAKLEQLVVLKDKMIEELKQ